MKSLKMRNALILVLSFVFALSMLVFAGTVKPVNAEETTTTVEAKIDHFKVMEAATIRIGDDADNNSGIRFRIEMNLATKTYVVDNDPVTDATNYPEGKITMGFIITPKYYFDKAITEGYTDYLTQMVKDSDTTDYAYVGVDGKGIVVDESESFYSAGDYWYVNGTIEKLNQSNVDNDLAYTAIGYIRTENTDGTATYTYTLPDVNFSRTYKQTASIAYMSDASTLETIKAAKYLDEFAGMDNPVGIYRGEDLYTLAKETTAENNFSGTYFKLINDVEVDYDFTQKISSEFNGTVNANEKIVSIVNNFNLDHVFAGETAASVTCENNTKLYNASEKGVNLFSGSFENASYKAKEYVPTTVTADDGTETAIPGATNLSTNTIKLNMYNAQYVYVNINYDKSDLTRLIPNYTEETTSTETETAETTTVATPSYYGVRIKYLALCDSVLYESGDGNMFEAFINNSYYKGATTSGTYAYTNLEKGYWRTIFVSLEDFVGALDGNKLYVGRISTRNATSDLIQFYFGDMELVKDTETIWSAEIYQTLAITETLNVDNKRISDTNGDGTVNSKDDVEAVEISEWYSQSQYNVKYYPKDSIPTSLNNTAVTGSFDGDVIYVRFATLKSAYAHLRYNKATLSKIAEDQGFTHVTITYAMVGGNNPTTLSGSTQAALSMTGNAGKTKQWHTLTLSKEDFLSYVGATYTYEQDDDATTIKGVNGSYPVQYDETGYATASVNLDEFVYLRRATGLSYVMLGNIRFTTIN